MNPNQGSIARWLLAGLAVATLGATLATPASAAARPARSTTTAAAATTRTGANTAAGAQAAVAAYWTKDAMAKATPVAGAVSASASAAAQLSATGAPGKVAPSAPTGVHPNVNASTTVGRVFFYNPVATANVSAGNHSCSASALNSGSKQLVSTAGHCVHGGAGGTWYQNWVFVPYYNYGNQPYGQFAAKQYRSFNSWISSSDLTRDVAMVTTWPNNLGKVVNVVGGNGLAWNFSKTIALTILAYPADPPYNGTWQQYCTGTTSDFGGTIGLHCGFTGGSSGGSWLMSYNGSTGYIDGDMSTLSSTGWNASPYYDSAVKSMYDAQANVT